MNKHYQAILIAFLLTFTAGNKAMAERYIQAERYIHPKDPAFERYVNAIDKGLDAAGCTLHYSQTEIIAKRLNVLAKKRPTLALYRSEKALVSGYDFSLLESAKNALDRGLQVILVDCAEGEIEGWKLRKYGLTLTSPYLSRKLGGEFGTWGEVDIYQIRRN